MTTPSDPQALRQLLFTTVSEQFDVPIERLSSETSAHDVEGWNSMAHGILIMTLEERLGFELPLEKVMEARNLGELLEMIQASL